MMMIEAWNGLPDVIKVYFGIAFLAFSLIIGFMIRSLSMFIRAMSHHASKRRAERQHHNAEY